MSRSAMVVIHIFMIVEVLSFFFFPDMVISKNLGLHHALLSGWTIGFITPSVGLSHEVLHLRNKNFFTRWLWHLNVSLGWIWPVVLHHIYSHHRYANTMKDHGHPYKNRNRLDYFWNYMIKPFPQFINYDRMYSIPMLISSVIFSVLIYQKFGWVGPLFQFGTVSGFYYTGGAGNYVQHYGLELLPLSNSDKAKYAWDDFSVLGKYFGFNIHLHSEHHFKPLKPFDQLSRVKGRPIVPYGTPLLMVLLLLPVPIFHRIMNKRLDRYLSKFKHHEV
jgi:hypothetical protein